MVTEAINTAKAASAHAENILVRGDSAFCAGKMVAAVVKAGAKFSVAIARSSSVDAAINSIPDDAYILVHYPGAVEDPDTGQLISDAQLAEVQYTAFADTPYEFTGWLVVRRVLDANTQDPLLLTRLCVMRCIDRLGVRRTLLVICLASYGTPVVPAHRGQAQHRP